MAILSAADLAELTAEIQRTSDCPGGISKPQLRAVYDALDAWWETTAAAAANAAIPQPQRGILSAKEKSAILMALLAMKYRRA